MFPECSCVHLSMRGCPDKTGNDKTWTQDIGLGLGNKVKDSVRVRVRN